MIKGISAITNLGKRSATIAMLAGAITLGTNAITKQSQTGNNTTPTELISKDAAAALKANAIVQTTPEVPNTHNYKLDRTLRKFIETEEDKKYIEDKIKTTYEKYGLFLGSAIIQHEVDIQQLYALLTANTKLQIKNNINPEYAKQIESKGPEFFKSMHVTKDAIENWLFEKYSRQILAILCDFDHKPTAEEVRNKQSYIVNNCSNFNDKELKKYVVYRNHFNHNNLHEESDNQSLADFIAFQMHMIDRLIIEKQLYKTGIYQNCYQDGKNHLSEYIDKWMESVEPKGKY